MRRGRYLEYGHPYFAWTGLLHYVPRRQSSGLHYWARICQRLSNSGVSVVLHQNMPDIQSRPCDHLYFQPWSSWKEKAW